MTMYLCVNNGVMSLVTDMNPCNGGIWKWVYKDGTLCPFVPKFQKIYFSI